MKRIALSLVAISLYGAPFRAPLAQSVVHLQTGPEAKSLIEAEANHTLAWTTFSQCVTSTFCHTNETIALAPTLAVTVFSPKDQAYPQADGSMTALQYVDLRFSTPIAGIGLDLEDAYRFTWLVGLEAYGEAGESLGKIEETGYSQSLHPPYIYFSALADRNMIWGIRAYTNYGTAPEGDIFNMGAASIVQLEPRPISRIRGIERR